MRWFTQAILALKYIHDMHILHRDLKSGNFFLSKSGNIKMGDFGIAKARNESMSFTSHSLVIHCRGLGMHRCVCADSNRHVLRLRDFERAAFRGLTISRPRFAKARIMPGAPTFGAWAAFSTRCVPGLGSPKALT